MNHLIVIVTSPPRGIAQVIPWSLLLTLFFLASAAPLVAQTPEGNTLRAGESAAQDSADIRAAALDYIQGWYEGDAERMKQAVHPRLEKRILGSELGAQEPLVEMSAEELVEATRRGGGVDSPGARRDDVTILDLFGNAASVRVDADRWIDYLHLVRTDQGWRIVNVLWELRPSAAGGR